MASSSNAKPRALYIVYWGAMEPLGRSLVLPAVEELTRLGAAVTLVTFDKPADLVNTKELHSVAESLRKQGVQWVWLRYHKQPKVPATLFDIFHGFFRGITLGLRQRPDIVHARTFVGGLIGLALAWVLRAKLVYHNEGFYPDEQVDGGVWRAGSTPHRVAKWLEIFLYRHADGIIAMSQRGKDAIQCIPQVRSRRTPVIVVPSCVDLNHFRFEGHGGSEQSGLRFVYAGSVGNRYTLDRIGRFVAVAAEMAEGVRLKILTRAEPHLVTALLDSGGLDRKIWSMESASRDEMPSKLAEHQVGLFFLTQGLSEHGCSPTKVGEYWAMGLPVVGSPNVSDIDDIVHRERVGVILEGHNDKDYRLAVNKMLALLRDPETPERCRRAAEAHYSLPDASRRQMRLYSRLCNPATENYRTFDSSDGIDSPRTAVPEAK